MVTRPEPPIPPDEPDLPPPDEPDPDGPDEPGRIDLPPDEE
jgi:hypothetical protein